MDLLCCFPSPCASPDLVSPMFHDVIYFQLCFPNYLVWCLVFNPCVSLSSLSSVECEHLVLPVFLSARCTSCWKDKRLCLFEIIPRLLVPCSAQQHNHDRILDQHTVYLLSDLFPCFVQFFFFLPLFPHGFHRMPGIHPPPAGATGWRIAPEVEPNPSDQV